MINSCALDHIDANVAEPIWVKLSGLMGLVRWENDLMKIFFEKIEKGKSFTFLRAL